MQGIILLVVALLSVMQSIFGVGLLVFGTPTLLLLDIPFDKALGMLLPASLTVSILQLVIDRRPTFLDSANFFLWSVPALSIGLIGVLRGVVHIHADVFIAVLLFVGAVTRLISPIRHMVGVWLKAYSSTALVIIGLVHGLTNMGGSLLALYSSITYNDKVAIRQKIALGYAIFATAQLTILSCQSTNPLSLVAAMTALIAGTTFLLIGRTTFHHIPYQRYNVLFSCLECGYGSVLVGKKLFFH